MIGGKSKFIPTYLNGFTTTVDNVTVASSRCIIFILHLSNLLVLVG